jgi:hypothetical protein
VAEMLEDATLIIEESSNEWVREKIRWIYENSIANPTINLWVESLPLEPVLYAIEEIKKIIGEYAYCACWLNIRIDSRLLSENFVERIGRLKGERLQIYFILSGDPVLLEKYGMPYASHFLLTDNNWRQVLGKIGQKDALIELGDLGYDSFLQFVKEIILLPIEERKYVFFTNHALSSTLHFKPNKCGAGVNRIVIDSEMQYPCYDAYKFRKKFGESSYKELLEKMSKSNKKCEKCDFYSCRCRVLYPFSDEERCKIIETMMANYREILMFY